MMATRKVKEKEFRRQHILLAAEYVFGRKPYDEVSMQEIAAQAELGMQGIYDHFQSKQVLYESAVLHRMEAFHRSADTALEGIEDPLERLSLLGRAFCRLFVEAPLFLPMFLREKVRVEWAEESRFGPRLVQTIQVEMDRVTSIYADAVRKRLVRDLDPRFLAQAAISMLIASLQHHLQYCRDEEPEEVSRRAETSFLVGVGLNQ